MMKVRYIRPAVRTVKVATSAALLDVSGVAGTGNFHSTTSNGTTGQALARQVSWD
jgi:hypothetical protein